MNDLSKLSINRDETSAAKTPRRRRSRWPYWVAAALLAVGGYYVKRGGFAAIPEVEVGAVSNAWPSQAVTLFNATGYVVPQTKADIASKATGRLEALEVEEGSTVKKGDVLARLESQDVNAAMQRAQANLVAAEAAVTEARARRAEALAKVTEANAEHLDATRALDRSKAMVDKNFVTREGYDAARWRHDRTAAGIASANASVAAADAGIAVAEAQVASARAALEETRVAVEYTLIRAPFDGVILSKHADIGDVVAPFAATTSSKGAVVTMADLNTLQVEADVSEASMSNVSVGQPCEIALDALPDVRLRGQVHMIVPTVDRTKATVLAKVRFVDIDKRILPDMSARVAFLSRAVETSEQKPVTVVASKAVVDGDGGRRVFTISDSTVRAVPVELGAALGDSVTVLNGLKLGDRIVLNPTAELTDGMRVHERTPDGK